MTPDPAFQFERTPLANRPRLSSVAEVEDVTPTYRRITLAGDFDGFDSLGPDDHLRIFLVPADTALSGDPETQLASMREHPSREYTPVAWDAHSLTLDFVIHGHGPASTWAAQAAPGSVLGIGGPRGSRVLRGTPQRWLLAGDRTALPAIRRWLALVEPGVPVTALLVAEDPADEQGLDTRGELDARWLRSQAELVETLETLEWPGGDGLVFIAAEQSIVKPGRAFLAEHGIELERATVKGYWKRGEAEYHAPH